MEHFTIFQDFYRVIAEMTEEEIVSAISNGTYRETVEDVRRIFAEQGEKAANEKKIELQMNGVRLPGLLNLTMRGDAWFHPNFSIHTERKEYISEERL